METTTGNPAVNAVNNKFSFDEDKKLSQELADNLNNDIVVFKSKLKISEDSELTEDDNSLIRAFANNNIRNISYYDKRIKEETRLQNQYNRWTIALAIAVPVLIFGVTLSVGIMADGNINMIEAITGSLTVLLASTLGAHKLITSYIEKRKFKASFHQAKVDLLNILFGILDEFENKAIGGETFENISHQGVLSDQFVIALKQAISKSRGIVDVEAQNYFKISGTPSYDLSSVLETSMTSAKSLVSGFKSKRADTESLRKQQESLQQRNEKIEDTIQENNSNLESKEAQLERLTKKEEWICSRIDALEELENPDAGTDSKIAALEAEHQQIEDKIDQLHIECAKLKSDIRYNQLKL